MYLENQTFTFREFNNKLEIYITCIKCDELMLAGHNGDYITGSEMKCPKCGFEIHLEIHNHVSE